LFSIVFLAVYCHFVEITYISVLIGFIILMTTYFGSVHLFGRPKSEEDELLPDQGAENIVPGYIEDYVVCENCQKASVDINAAFTQCPMCKAQFERGIVVAK